MNRLTTTIRQKRKVLNLTQAQLAEGIISVPYLSLIENGKATPGLEILTLLAQRLQTNPNQLLGVSDQKIVAEIQSLLHLIHHDLIQTRFIEARDKIEQSRELALPLGDLQQLIEIDLMEIQCCLHDWECTSHALFLLKEFEERWERTLENKESIFKYLCTKGYAELKQFRFKQAFQYFKEAKKLGAPHDDPFNQISMYQGLGYTSIYLDNASLSFTYLAQMRQFAQENHQPIGVVNSLMYLSEAYHHVGETSLAITYLHNILQMRQQLNIPSLLLCRIYTLLAIFNLEQNHFDKTSQLLQTAFKTVEAQSHNQFSLGLIQKIKGLLALKQNHFAVARQYLKSACEELHYHLIELAECYIYLGQLEYTIGDYGAFESYYQKAFAQYENIALHRSAGTVAATLADFYLHQNQERAATPYLVKATRHYQLSSQSHRFISQLPRVDA